MDESLKSSLFKSALESPGTWLLTALHLKEAADHIDYYKYSKTDPPVDGIVFLFPVYKLLLGYSFENLLKGIIVAQGRSGSSTVELDETLKKHNVDSLINLIDTSQIAISNKERKILQNGF